MSAGPRARGEPPGALPFPPEPWRLVGTAWVSLWIVPGALVPRESLGPDLALGPRVLLATAFARYEPGGTLAYHELLVAVRVAGPAGGCTHVPRIWVDHPESVAGARAMWRVPKALARFSLSEEPDGFRARADDGEGAPIGSLRFRPVLPLPGRWPLRTRVGQGPLEPGDPPLTVTPVAARARPALGRAAWTFAPDGPLGFLSGRAPAASAMLRDVSLTFGG